MRGSMSVEDFLANALADAAADAKASSMIEPTQAVHIEKAEGLAYAIAMRLAEIEAAYRKTLPEKVWIEKECKPRPVIKPMEEQSKEILCAIREKGHDLISKGAFVVCQRCRCRRKDANNTKMDPRALPRSAEREEQLT